MFVLSKKLLIKRIALISACVALIFVATFAIIKQVQRNVSASTSTADGEIVTVLMGEEIQYGGSTSSDHVTHRYSIVNSSGGDPINKAMCAEPNKGGPNGTQWFSNIISMSEMRFKKIKLIMYIYFYQDNGPVAAANKAYIDNIMSDDSENLRFAYVHSLVGYFYSGDTSGLAQGQIVWANTVGAQLEDMINNNDIKWQAAQNVNLHMTTGDSVFQRIAWIEEAPIQYGKIVVNKIDADTGTCTTSAALSFNGITFSVINKTGGNIIYNGNTIANNGVIDTKTLSGGNCSVEFSDLSYGQYAVREGSVPAGYTGEADKTVDVAAASQTVSFTNSPKKGKIIVNKIDSETGTCIAIGDLSLVGTQFTLINSTGGPVKYGGQSYANGATIAVKSIASGACSVEFDGLPYGKYTVNESSASTGYAADVASKEVTLSGDSATVSFSNTSIKGKITVSKKDSVTDSCTTQGNASFDGTRFELTNNSNNAIVYGGRTIAKGAVVDTKTLTGGACNVEFTNLPYGTYIVKEIAVGTGYQIDNTAKTVTIPTNNSVNVAVSYANDPILGDVTVNKIDSTTGTCATTGNLSFNGVTFTITNNSDRAVIYGGNSYAKGSVIDTKSLANNACNVKFENLPYGEYIVKETRISEGYARNTSSYTVTIPTNSSVNVSTTIPNDPIRGDVKFVKYDEDNDEVMSNVLFSISAVDENNQILETHIVVSDENGVVDTSSSFALHTNNTNGYDILYDALDEIRFAGYGTWFGLDKNGIPIAAQDSLGALPYGTYIIQELRCGANFFCTGVLNQKATITINSHNQVVDLGDWNNNCTKFSLDTVAEDGVDGDKYIEVNGQATLKDTIDYCVTPNMDFVIKGILMDKTTGEPLLVNGETVEQQVRIRSSVGCDTTEMVFTFDASEMGGKTLVVFESLYYVNGFESHLITEHNDINDDDQSVDVISFTTLATNKETGEKTLPVNSDSVIRDIVSYCLRPGVEYTVKGILMDGETKNAALSNSETVESETTFTPTEACGSFEVYYNVNTKDLAGRKLIIFDSLYMGDELILEHKDFNNENETVVVDLPAPDTGFMTRIFGGGKEALAPVVSVFAGAVIFVVYKRSRKSSGKMTFDKK